MKKPFDLWLDKIDKAANEADLDGRAWKPQREDIKDHLSTFIHEVSIDAGQEFAEVMIDIIKRGYVPSDGRIEMEVHQITAEYNTPTDDGGRYSLY